MSKYLYEINKDIFVSASVHDVKNTLVNMFNRDFSENRTFDYGFNGSINGNVFKCTKLAFFQRLHIDINGIVEQEEHGTKIRLQIGKSYFSFFFPLIVAMGFTASIAFGSPKEYLFALILTIFMISTTIYFAISERNKHFPNAIKEFETSLNEGLSIFKALKHEKS